MPRKIVVARAAVVLVAAAALVAVAAVALVGTPPDLAPSAGASVSAPPSLSADAPRALPEADYAAVIAGLIAHDEVIDAADVARIDRDLPLFDETRRTPVARLAARDFLDEPTTVVVVHREGPWSLVLTPSREVLPSEVAGGTAPAQTAAWAPTSGLGPSTSVSSRIEISVSRQELRIVGVSGEDGVVFPAAVGAADTPTPTGVTGHLQQRYVDPSQGTGDHPIQLSSLHATAADEPFGGSDGGLIGLHWNPTTTGAVSHGCVRLDASAVAAVDSLALGTLITVTA